MLLIALVTIAVVWATVVAVMIGVCVSAARGDGALPRAPRQGHRRRFRTVASA